MLAIALFPVRTAQNYEPHPTLHNALTFQKVNVILTNLVVSI